MRIHVPDAEAEQRLTIDEVEDLVVRRDGSLRQLLQPPQHEMALTEIAEGELACDKAMPENLPAVEQPAEPRVAGPQMVDPDRRVCQGHSSSSRRRGGYRQIGLASP